MKRRFQRGIFFASLAAALALMPGRTFASVSGEVARGIDALGAGRFEEAEAALRRAQFDAPDDPRIAYDLGITAYQERRFEAAARQFESIASSPAVNAGLAADALHNLGNARFSGGEYRKAVDAYQASLVRREDPATQYNLEQALKRLEEQERADRNDQDSRQNDSSQGQDGKNKDSNKDSKQDGKKSGEKSGSKEEQSGQNGSDNQNQGQNGSEKKEGQGGRQNQNQGNEAGTASDTRNNRPESQAGNTASETSRQADQQQSQPRNPNASDTSNMAEQTPASGSASWNEQDAKLRDVQLDPKTQSAKDIPDASERARAMKNTKLNGYMVEKILRQMEDREREIQRRYRRDPSQREDMMNPFDDPFFMDPDQMREFMEGRQGARQQKPEGNTPDW
ncbi:MAG TPA: tetratricopeptide repeat protein [Candidatus Ozemobacteraceae bacterium]|nr:tetratricopeptide repeat protein [Candidatus Ozemobacteraceae bacterium]